MCFFSLVFRMPFIDNLSAEIVPGHTLILVFCLYFCLGASAHNINRRLFKCVPVVSAWVFALSRAWPCLEERLHSPLYPCCN